jgi:CRISPR-associated protein Cmr3
MHYHFWGLLDSCLAAYAKEQRKKEKAEQQAHKKQAAPQTCVQGQFNFQFHALDTWFFRESRPHDAVGASELSSLFPPPVRTLIGAIRSFLGEQLAIDWTAFSSSKKDQPFLIGDLDFKQAVGDADNLGELKLKGPWVCCDGQRLYPAPFYLMQKEGELKRLRIGAKVRCDLGTVRLPELPEDCDGYKNVDQAWITAGGWKKLLMQDLPDQSEIKYLSDLLDKEPRLGIARSNATRTVLDGKLYQTQHIRLKEQVGIELDVHGLQQPLAAVVPEINGPVLLRLGGEGRMAELTVKQQHEPLPSLDSSILNKPAKKIIIHFMTHADFDRKWFPETISQDEGRTVWQGEIKGIKLTIVAAVIGKVHREGGWDMQKHRPRAVKSFIPAGSAWFCQVDDETVTWQMLIDKLHGHCIGLDAAYGRGQMLIGRWDDNEQL